MPDDVTIEMRPGDAEALNAFMARLQSQLGYDAEQSVSWAAYYVAKSMGVSTRRAPKALRLRKAPGGNPEFPRRLYPWYVVRYRGGQPWNAYVKADADTEKARRNPKAGLAAQSWLWAAGDLGYAIAKGNLRRPSGAVSGTLQRGLNPTATLSNKLNYIMSAVRSGGPRGVETAFERGGKAGIHYLDGKLRKALK